MERTKFKETELKLPDAINCSISKDFTQIPNDVLRNVNISAKAKALLCLLLSNKNGWFSHFTSIQGFMKEGDCAIQSGLQELEYLGYLLRIKYRNKKTKAWKGSFWAYTDIPQKFDLQEHTNILLKGGMELIYPHIENLDKGNPGKGNQELIIHNSKNTKCRVIPPETEWVREYCQVRKNGVDSEEWFNFYESKGWMIGKNRMINWQAAIRTWEKGKIKTENKFKPKFIRDPNLGRFDLFPDGEYYHCSTHEKHIP